MAFTKRLGLGTAALTFLSLSLSSGLSSDAMAEEATFGLGVSARQLQLTRGLAEFVTEAAPPGTRTEGYSIEFARRGKNIEFVLGFGYDNLEASNGYYLQTAGDPSVPGETDFTDFSGFHWYTVDATFIGYLELHKLLAIRYGAGLGVGIVRGEINRTDAICTSDNIQRHCERDPNGEQQDEAIGFPPVLPVFHSHVGLQFRPFKSMAINIDAGLRTVPYLGASAMFYLW